jgi:membrane-bound lytic murein transglycosylase B
MLRRSFVFSAAALAGTGLSLNSARSQSASFAASGDTVFDAWRTDFYDRSVQAGWPAQLLQAQLADLTPDPGVSSSDAKQPEFSRPVSDYLRGVVSDERVSIGRGKLQTLTFLPHVEQRFGVPKEILVGVWAMESAFGKIQGTKDVVRSLATLAAQGRRRSWAEGELYACLKIIASGEVTRERLKGSWAGAMGQTQFLPSNYLNVAVDEDGDGKRDIWGSDADALASAASLLAKGGWQRGVGWAREVVLPDGFDYGQTEETRIPVRQWLSQGVRRADGLAFSAADSAADANLLLPAGAAGPAFLALPNHYAIRKYNNSTSYALGIGLLADRMGGDGPLRTPWPVEAPMSLADRQAAQVALSNLGFDPGAPDGVIGAGTRKALRAWQKTAGVPADGYLSADMVRRLQAAANFGVAVPPPPR